MSTALNTKAGADASAPAPPTTLGDETRLACRRAPRHGSLAFVLALVLTLFASGVLAGALSEVPATSPPDLSLADLSGQTRSLDELAGKVVLVNFWASWCTPCIQEMPSLKRLTKEMGDESFAIISVNVGEAKRRVQANVKRLDISFPVLLDKDKAVFHSWGASVLPTAYLLDRNGQIRFRAHGELEWDRVDVIEVVRKLAGQTIQRDQ